MESCEDSVARERETRLREESNEVIIPCVKLRFKRCERKEEKKEEKRRKNKGEERENEKRGE